MISSPALRRAAVAALAALAITWPGMLSTRAQAQAQPREAFLVPRLPAAISPPGMPAVSATPRRRRPITAPRCAAIPATTSCSAAPSWRCWPMARSTRRSGSPSAFCRSTRTTASRGSSSGCARSSRSNIRPRAASSPNRSAGRSPISRRRCCRPGRWRTRTRPSRRPTPSTSSPARTGTPSSRSCMPR